MTIARLTAAGIARRSTGGDDPCLSSRASLPGPGLELSFQKIVGHCQLPNLGVKLLHRSLIDHWFPEFAAALKDAWGTFQQRTLPLMVHRRMNAKPGRQLGNRVFAFQRLKRDLGLEFGIVFLAFRHRQSPLRWRPAERNP